MDLDLYDDFMLSFKSGRFCLYRIKENGNTRLVDENIPADVANVLVNMALTDKMETVIEYLARVNQYEDYEYEEDAPFENN
jgi:hypothetical protein